MKKLVKVIYVSLLLSLVVNASDEFFKGYIISRSDKVHKSDNFGNLQSSITVEYKGEGIRIATKDIKKIIHIKNDKYLLVKKNGKEFKVGLYLRNLAENFKYNFFDEINEKMKFGYTKYGYIKEIVFDDDFGHVKCDSKGNVFPPDYIFSPYTGKKLKLKALNE